jgi:simple sugar transport system ATP-binding protein
MSLADRIVVIYHGQIVATVDAGQVTKSELGLLMAGSQRQAVAAPSVV